MTAEEGAFVDRLEIVAEALSDGFHLRDLAIVLRESVELAERFCDLSSAGKRELAISFVKEVISRTDGPGPDLLLDPILEAIAPPLVDLIINASKGKLFVNGGGK